MGPGFLRPALRPPKFCGKHCIKVARCAGVSVPPRLSAIVGVPKFVVHSRDQFSMDRMRLFDAKCIVEQGAVCPW